MQPLFSWGISSICLLEPVCCKKQQKKVPDQLLVCGIGYLWRTWFQTDCIWVQVIPLIIQYQFYTIQNLQRSPIPQTSNWSGTFFCCFLQETGLLYSPRLRVHFSNPLILIATLVQQPEKWWWVLEGFLQNFSHRSHKFPRAYLTSQSNSPCEMIE